MKYLKYILGIIVVLFLVFLLLGVLKPELTYDCEIIVDKPVAETWAVVQDEAKMEDWLTGFQKMEHVSGTPGEVGSVSNVFFDNNGQTMSIQETITEILPNESISMDFASDFMDMDYKMKVSPLNGKTKISTSTTAKGNGVFSKSMMVLAAGSVKGQEVTNLEKLKKVIEENTKDYFESSQEIGADIDK